EATSAAGAGFVAIWAAVTARPYDEDEEAVERYGLDFYEELQEGGCDVDFRRNGLLLVGATPEAFAGWQGVRRERYDAATVEVLPEQIEELTAGAVLAAGVSGGVYQPDAGQVFTPKVGRALAARLEQEGVRVETRRPALGLRVEGDRVTGVETASGTLACDAVVLAAGAWANALLRPLGRFLPCVPHVTSRVITESLGVPESLPALMLTGLLPEGPRLWVRQHQGGLLWGGVQQSYPRRALVGLVEPPTRLDEIALDGVREGERAARAAAAVMPALSRHRSLRVKHGAPCFTPDHRALVGALPGIDGLYAIAGDNEAGVTHGPGFAKFLAETIVAGSSSSAGGEGWAVDRFGERFADLGEVAAAVDAALAA
ncbi:MAG: FAD-binding oxidoreductase, partial [Actinobacteria bacterium]|nr:FAD-binding oxidoreductase [Actinomycetota bacterium]